MSHPDTTQERSKRITQVTSIRWPRLPVPRGFSSRAEARQVAFFVTFSLIGKIAQPGSLPDRKMLESARRYIRVAMNFGAEDELMALTIVSKARALQRPYEALATEYYELYGSNRKMLRCMTDALSFLTFSSSNGLELRTRMLYHSMRIFGLTQNEFIRISSEHRLRYEHSEKVEKLEESEIQSLKRLRILQRKKLATQEQMTLRSACRLLGCRPSDSPERIRQKYRELAFKFHPDRVSDDHPGEKAHAREQFATILRAYQLIRDEKGFR